MAVAEASFKTVKVSISLGLMVASALGAVSYTHLDVYKRQQLLWSPTIPHEL